MLTTHDVQRISLGKEGAPRDMCFMLCALTQKDQVRITRTDAPKCAARMNEPEVNQTKPEHPARAGDLCR